MQKAVVTLKCRIPNAIDRVQMICDVSALEDLDELDKASLLMRYREILLQGFTFGFEVLLLCKNYCVTKVFCFSFTKKCQNLYLLRDESD